jgi:hypothetical protein
MIIITLLESSERTRGMSEYPQQLLLTRHIVIERKEEMLCKSCETQQPGVVLLPCGHVAICENCAKKQGEGCPNCSAQISGYVNLYAVPDEIPPEEPIDLATSMGEVAI